MRIAYIINSLEGGGAAFPVPSILSLMRFYGAEVKIFALTKKDGKAIPSIQQASLEISLRNGSIKDHYHAYQWLNQQIQAYQPTHLWTSLTRATLLGQLIGAKNHLPVISWQHAAYLKPWNQRLLKATRNLSKLWIGDSEAITTITKQRLAIPDNKIITWPIFQADPNAPQANQRQPNEPIRIASMGRLHPIKNYNILIEAIKNLQQNAASLPNYKISIYGDGNEYQNLLQLIHHYKLTPYIELAGFTSNVQEILAKHHLYIQPSQSEGFCVAAHEAMQAGLPVIASHVGELALSIQNGITGYTVNPGNPIALANTLRFCLENPEQIYPMGQRAREKIINDFSQEQFKNIGYTIFQRMSNF